MKQLALLILFVVVSTLHAQNITGTIYKSDGKPAKGIRIGIKDSKEKIKTSSEGTFTVQNVQNKDSLLIEIDKNRSAVIAIDDQALTMTIEKSHLNVNGTPVAYKVKSRKSNSNVITSEEIKKSGARSVSDLIKGQVPGVNVATGPQGTRIIIRGMGSFGSAPDPLYILNGSETTLQVLDSLNMEDIESVEVSKTGIGYGSKGGNGVIIVKTKKH